MVWLFLLPLIFFENTVLSCDPPPNTAGITFEAGVFNRDEYSIKSTYSCECEGIGVRAYYPSNTKPIPVNATSALQIYLGKAMIPNGLLGTANDCPNFCTCSENGKCYTSNEPYTQAKFIPYCVNSTQCHMYVSLVKGSIKSEKDGSVWPTPNYNQDPVGPNSGYLKVNAASCNGCNKIRKPPVCEKVAQNCTTPSNSAGMIVDIISFGSDLSRTAMPIGKCQCQRRIKYFWKSIPSNVPPTAKWAYDNFQTAMIINTEWECMYFCMCAENGDCFTIANKDYINLIHFVPYCNGSDCHIYAVVDLSNGRRPIQYENKTLYYPPVNSYTTYLNSTSGFIKVYSVSCIRCERTQYRPQCEGATVTRKDNEIMSKYPYVLYTDPVSKSQVMIYDFLSQEMLEYGWETAMGQINRYCRAAYMSSVSFGIPRFWEICYNISVTKFLKTCTKCSSGDIYTMVNQLSIDTELKLINLGLLYFFGIIGILASMGLFKLVLKEKEMQTSFGTLCAILAVMDIVYLVLSLGLEGGYCLYKTTSGEIFRYQLSFIIFYLHISTSMMCATLSLAKSFNRTVALFFPLFYRNFSKPKIMANLSIIFLTIFFAVNAPILFLDDNRNFYFDIEFDDLDQTVALKFFYNVYNYTDYVVFVLSLLFDVLTAAKLYLFHRSRPDGWTKEKILQESLLLAQNLSNVFLFALTLIPFLLYVKFCGSWRRYCYDTSFEKMIVVLYYYNARRASWRSFDELISFLIQYRIWHRVGRYKTKAVNLK